MSHSRIIYSANESKKRKKKFSGRFVIASILSFLFFGVLSGAGFFVTQHAHIKNVEVSGLKVLNSEEIKSEVNKELEGAFAFILPKNSYFVVSTTKIKEKLLALNPRIADIAITKEYPESLQVNLTEREPWGIYCNDLLLDLQKDAGKQKCFYIDKSGFSYEDAPLTTGTLINKIRGDAENSAVGTQLVDPETISLMERIANKLRELDLRVSVFEIRTPLKSEIRVQTHEGFALIIKRTDDFQNVFNVLKTVLANEIKGKRSQLDYIDLRFGNKVFYKFRN